LKSKTTFLLLAVAILLTTMIVTPKTEAASPTVSISKLYNMTEPGTTFIVNITVSDVTNLKKWAVDIEWDPTIVRVTEGDPNGTKPTHGETNKRFNIYEGPFLKQAGSTHFEVSYMNNTRGVVGLYCDLTTPGSSATGSGVLATINFTLIEKGTTKLDIIGPNYEEGTSTLTGANLQPIPHADSDGIVSDKSPPTNAQIATLTIIDSETGESQIVFDPETTPVNTTFTINVTAANVDFLNSWQINITWDPTLLKVNSTEDATIPPDNVFGEHEEHFGLTITSSSLYWVCGIPSGAPMDYVNVTEGTLCQITFTIIRNQTDGLLSCPIHFVLQGEHLFWTKLVDPDANNIEYTTQDGAFIIPEFPMNTLLIILLIATIYVLVLSKKIMLPRKPIHRTTQQ